MDDVFKALADPTRRSLLDELFKQDGQTLAGDTGRAAADDAVRRDEAPEAARRGGAQERDLLRPKHPALAKLPICAILSG